MSETWTGESGGLDDGRLIALQVEKLRTKLLDLTARNPLISFRHGSRTKRFVRVIDELPDQLYAKLESDATMKFQSLGEDDEGPADERTIQFRRALDSAKLDDPEYLQKTGELGDEPGEKAIARLEEELRLRLRELLGMAPRKAATAETAADAARRRGLDPSFDLPVFAAAGARSRHADSTIQTLLFAGPMERTLGKLRDQVRLSVSETGVNPLFMVFGFIEWYEEESSQTPIHAPLLLYPLEIDRELQRGRFHYTAKSTGEGVVLNVAIAERFRRDFGINLPEPSPDSTPEEYFAAVQKILEPQRNWKLRRWVTAGLFSFARIAMYHDLDPKNWTSGGGLEGHEQIGRLLNVTGGGSVSSGREPAEDDAAADRAEQEVPLISDADSSQLAAIREVLAGRSLVIEGPPGTGKSQTITNLIAAAMAAGKTVLFLAEKNAALNVVKSRLQHAGLSAFCLELHSTKAGRKETAKALAARLFLRRPKNVDLDLEATLKDLASSRRHLWECVKSLSQPAGALGITTHDLIWRCNRVREQTGRLPSDVDTLTLSGVESLTEVDLARIVTTADQLERIRNTVAALCGSPRRHPWYGVAGPDLNLLQCDQLVRKVQELSDAAARSAALYRAVDALCGWAPTKLSSLPLVAGAASIPEPAEEVDEQIVRRASEREVLASLRRFVQDVQEHERLTVVLGDEFQDAARPASCDPGVMEAFAKAVDAAGLKEKPIGELTGAADHRERESAAWTALGGLMADVGARLGCGEPLLASVERRLVSAVSLAAEAYPKIAGARTPALVAAGAVESVGRAGSLVEGLRQRRSALRAMFTIDAETDSTGLLAHAKALRGAPPLPFLSWSWWKARARFKGLCKTPIPADRNQAAGHLEEIARHIDDVKTLEADGALRALLGNLYKGLDSDVGAAAAVAAWADKVRSVLPAHDEVGLNLRRTLFECDAGVFEFIAALAGHPRFQDLSKVVAASRGEEATVESQRIAAERRAAAAREAARLAPALGLKLDRLAGAAAEIAPHVRALRGLTDELTNSKAAADAVGPMFKGAQTPTAPLIASIQYVQGVSESSADPRLQAWLLQGGVRERWRELRALGTRGVQERDEITRVLAELSSICAVDFARWVSAADPLETNPAELAEHAGRCAADPEGLQLLVDHERLAADLRHEGFGEMLKLLESTGEPIRDLGGACRRVAYQSLTRAMLTRLPALASFSGDRFENHRTQFRTLDRKLQKLRQEKLEHDLSMRSVEPGSDVGSRKTWTGEALVRLEAGKQERHVPVRDLLERGGRAIQQLMPCFMMSPLSVAQYLKPGVIHFDIVIMDEASQIRPEDALGAIGRASQVVVVGDPKQLPPSNFFDRAEASTAEEDEGSAVDEKSILDLAASIMPMRRLTWHYRSKHPSLIAFSNKEFYDDKLVVFPSPKHHDPTLGVRYIHVPDGAYKQSVNAPEARRVALSVVEHAKLFPKRSLGVVTLNKAQAELLQLELDELAAMHPEFEEWRRSFEETLEPFFVKNLENVQGDERDCIYISTVYGKPDDGPLAQRFGPINNAGGHRRLNVLFTRAKQQTTVFSSMDPGEIRADESSPWGVRALKGFLAFAKTGVTESPLETGRAPDSDFEVAVAGVLRDAGFNVAPQIGVAGYFIDLAVRHPERAGEFVLGIECDGAAYHCTRSARDRDRLRQEILEKLQWRIHRIWSLDWFRNNRRERERLIQAVRTAIAAASE